MSKIFNNLLPIRSFLYVFQSEEYVVSRFLGIIVRKPIIWNVEKVKQLTWTFKSRFLFVTSFVLCALQVAILILMKFSLTWILVSIVFFWFFPWIYLIISLYLIKIREIFNRWYLKVLARRKINRLKENGLKVIGITGSYGKTSTKMFADKILNEQFDIYATPKSYNTLFGIAQAKFKFGKELLWVNSVLEYLREKTEIFLVEMGAYYIGEIKELCEAYPPDIGILTGITFMHHEKFGSLENTIKAKSELHESLPDGAKMLMNLDSAEVLRIYEKEKATGRLEVISYGFNEDADYRIKVEEMTKDGTRFTLYYGHDELSLMTRLVGTGNIRNIAGACALAIELEVETKKIKGAVESLEAVEARMQMIYGAGGIITINNGYSSNPESFKQTLETLKYFTTYKKVLVTPGLFELGDITEKVHEELGEIVTDEIDLVLLLGKNEQTPQIKGLKRGLKTAGFPEERVKFIDDIKKSYEIVTEMGFVPCVMVLENDLPDLYNI